MMQPRSHDAAFESPWFWLAVFLAGALVSLTIVAPRFAARQPQIERQYHARERSGYAVPSANTESASSSSERLMIPLRPLQLLLSVALLASAAIFWIQRFRHRRPHVRHVTK